MEKFIPAKKSNYKVGQIRKLENLGTLFILTPLSCSLLKNEFLNFTSIVQLPRNLPLGFF